MEKENPEQVTAEPKRGRGQKPKPKPLAENLEETPEIELEKKHVKAKKSAQKEDETEKSDKSTKNSKSGVPKQKTDNKDAENAAKKGRAKKTVDHVPEPETAKEAAPKKGRAKKADTATTSENSGVPEQKTADTEKEAVKQPASKKGRPKRGEIAATAKDSAVADKDNEEAVKQPAARKGRAKKTEKAEQDSKEDAAKQPAPKKGRAKKADTAVTAVTSDITDQEMSESDKKEQPAKQPASAARKREAKKIGKATTSSNANEGNTKQAAGEVPVKKPRLAKETGINIISWNVGGIRALSKKDGTNYLLNSNAEIVCLQEVKCSEENLPEDLKQLEKSGYPYSYWVDSKKPGYAGCATWSKKEPLSCLYGIGDDETDKEGRLITLEFDNFYLVNVYVPNSGRKLVTLPKRMEWNDRFKDFITKLENVKPVIIVGDMNVAHQEIDLARPSSNRKNAGFTDEERHGMTDFLEMGFIDTYRQLNPEKTGAYTFWSYMGNSRAKNVGWRLDYGLISAKLEDDLVECHILPEVAGSDHCPICLVISTDF